MNPSDRLLKLSIPLLVTALLNACGGGGGGSSGGTPPIFGSAKSWGTATTLGSAANAPHIAMNGDGNAIVIWAQSDRLYAARFTRPATWTVFTNPIDSSTAASAPTDYQVAIDEDGNAFAVWIQEDSGGHASVWVNRFDATTPGWGTAAVIEADDNPASAPQIATDANGNAITVWIQDDGGDESVLANRFDAAIAIPAWDTAAPIEDDAGDAGAPQIAFDTNGNAIAVWHQSDGTRNNIIANRYAAVGGWAATAAAPIESDNTGDALHPQIAFDTTGNAIAVWEHNSSIWANRYTGGWTTANAAAIESNAGAAINPRIAFDANGNAIAVWQQLDGSRYDIWTRRYSTVGTPGWVATSLSRLETNDIGDAVTPDIAFDGLNNAFAVWAHADIRARRYNTVTGWQVETPIGTSGTVAQPQIATDRNGYAIAVWLQDGSAWRNRYE